MSLASDASNVAVGVLGDVSKAAVTGVVLAAGRGERFGGDKLLASTADGKVLLDLTLAPWLQTLDDIVVVVRRRDVALRAHLARLTDAHHHLRCVVNEDADEGMGTSIASGVGVSPNASAWMIGLGDMPWVPAQVLSQLRLAAEAAASGAAQIVLPEHKGQHGHPVVFSASFRNDLLGLGGDRGARSVIDANPGAVRSIPVDSDGVLRDVDVPVDLKGTPAA
jgi:molybdenum cofactor cytidylyltransferase